MGERTYAVVSGKGPDGRPTPILVAEDGSLQVSSSASGGATAANQVLELDALADLLVQVTGVSKDASVQAVTAAVEAMADGTTLTELLTELGLHGDALDTVIARLDTLITRTPALVAGRVPVDGSGVTQPVSAASLPLPAGASTATKQDELKDEVDGVEESLASIDAKTTTPGPQTPANSVSSTLAVITETAAGAITPAAKFTLKSSAGRLRWIRVGYRGTGTAYVIFHDAASTGAIVSGTIKGFGYYITAASPDKTISFADAPRSFAAGISVALSTTQDTYTASVETMVVEGGWE